MIKLRTTALLFTSIFLVADFSLATDPPSIELELPSRFAYQSKTYALQKGGVRELTGHSVGTVEFLDGDNFRTTSISLMAIQSGYEKQGKNLKALEEENVLSHSELLSVRRESDYFKGVNPDGTNELRELAAKHLPNDSIIVLKQTVDRETRKECLGSFGVFVFAIPFQESKLDKIDLSSVEIVESSPNRLIVRQRLSKSEESFHFIPLHEKWVLAESSAKLWDPSQMKGVRSRESETKLTDSSSNSFSYAKKFKSEHSNGQKYDALETCELTNMEFGAKPQISLSITIKNKTPVILYDNQQIKAAWLNGKVVRVFDSETVDDLSNATFNTESSSALTRPLLLFAMLIVGGVIVFWCMRWKR